jgi:hypothetical protein
MASLQMAGAPLVARRGSAKKASKALRRAMRCNAATAEETEAKLITYPFVKLIGQDELKLALTLNVIVSTPHLSQMSPRRPPTPDRIIHYPGTKKTSSDTPRIHPRRWSKTEHRADRAFPLHL